MLRDSPAGLIEPIFRSAGVSSSRAVDTESQNKHRTIDPKCLENPPPRRGGTYTNGERRFSISR